MPAENRQAVLEHEGLGQPSRKVNDAIWLIIVGAFAIAFVVAAVALVIGRFQTVTTGSDKILTSSDMVLTVVTTTAAFLAGLLAPSPLHSGGQPGGPSGGEAGGQ